MTKLAKDYRRIFKLTPKQAQRIADKQIELCGWRPDRKLLARIDGQLIAATAEELAA